jgi:catechol 2,3-dioxygenase-like lactoylglutathione lyase family enzyme
MKTRGIGPAFQVGNLTDALKYYKDVLGFKEDFQFGAYAGVSHGDACLHLSANRFHQRPVGGGSAFIFCDEVDDYCQEIKKNGAVIKVSVSLHPCRYSTLENSLKDLRLGFPFVLVRVHSQSFSLRSLRYFVFSLRLCVFA